MKNGQLRNNVIEQKGYDLLGIDCKCLGYYWPLYSIPSSPVRGRALSRMGVLQPPIKQDGSENLFLLKYNSLFSHFISSFVFRERVSFCHLGWSVVA